MSTLSKKWEMPLPDQTKVDQVKKALEKYGVTENKSVRFILSVLESTGLFWDPIPERGSTAREIEKNARSIHGKLAKQDYLSQKFQIVRGGRVISKAVQGGRVNPNDTGRGSRGEPEVTHACRLIDCHLRRILKFCTVKRWGCIADILIQLEGHSSDTLEFVMESVRKRLERAFKKDGPFDDDYKKRFSEFEVGLY